MQLMILNQQKTKKEIKIMNYEPMNPWIKNVPISYSDHTEDNIKQFSW